MLCLVQKVGYENMNLHFVVSIPYSVIVGVYDLSLVPTIPDTDGRRLVVRGFRGDYWCVLGAVMALFIYAQKSNLL